MTVSIEIVGATPPASESTGNAALDVWVKRMCEVELPAVSATVAKIQQLSQDDDCAVQALADVILQDAAMTAHVLRLTSSAYHVRSSRSNSITRALVILGFKEVRAICLSIAVMDDLIKKGSQKPFTTELARAFHAAVQSEQLACSVGDRSPQDVFIAALLYNLGNMLFWCFGEEKRDELTTALEVSGPPSHEIERAVLGFELRELTEALAKKWGLGDLLVKAVNPSETGSNRVHGVRLGHRFVKAVEQGWDTPEVMQLIGEMGQLTGMSPAVLTPMLHTAAAKAQEVARGFNADSSADEIPSPDSEPKRNAAVVSAPVPVWVPLESDPAYQLQALQNISLKLEALPEVHEVIEFALDGIYKGLGMDRVLFAILSPNRKYLTGKSAFGYNFSELIAQFKFPVESDPPNIFSSVIEGHQAVWVPDQSAPVFNRLVTGNIRQVIGESPFFIAPTVVTGKPIGIIFADRWKSQRPLDANLFQGFKQFAITVNISLDHLKVINANIARERAANK